jgi:iron complex outermembrane receptor protein
MGVKHQSKNKKELRPRKTPIALSLASAIAALALHAAAAAEGEQQVAQTDQKTAAEDQPAGEGLQEIVVTAEKHKERLQDVPASIEAMTSEALEQRGITGVQSLVQGDIPSVRVEPFAGNQSVLEVGIRGFIDPNGSDITNENPVPIYIDDVYYGRQNAMALELNDLQRLEVLRGPQGTLFGKNAEGGALRLVSKPPTGQFGADMKAEVGNFGYWKAVGHINLPEVAGLSSKIDLLSTENHGWTTNPGVGQHNFGMTRASGAKVTLLYTPVDRLSLEYAGDYTDLRTSEAFNAQLSSTDPYTFGIWHNQTATPSSEPYALYRPLDPQIYWGHRFNVDFKLDEHVNVRSIMAYRQDSATFFNTASTSTALPGPFLFPGVCTPAIPLCTSAVTGPVPEYFISHHQFSEELQFVGKYAKWDWVGGLFYIKEGGSQNEITYLGTLVTGAVNLANAATGFLPYNTPTGSVVASPLIGPVGTAGVVIDENSKAIFGQATYHPDERWALTAGARVGRDEKSALRTAASGAVYSNPVSINPRTGALTPASTVVYPCPTSPQCNPSVSDTHTSPMAAVSYVIVPDVSTYFRYATGYQSDGLSVGSQLLQYVRPSKVNSYEIGLKSEFDQRKVRFNLAVFHEDWKDPQENVQTTSSSTVEFFSGPTIKINGLELDTAWKPVKDLTLTGEFTWMHGSQPAIGNPFAAGIMAAGVPVIPANLHLVNLPTWAGSLSANWDFLHTSYGVARASISANGTGSYYSVPNVATPVGSYWLIDGRIALADIGLGRFGSMEVAVWGKNLANKSYNTFIYAVPGIAGVNTDGTFGMPRTYGASLAYKFE